MRIISLRIFSLFLAAGAFLSCGTIFPAQVKNITINSEPATADVQDASGKIVGTTPYSFNPIKGEKYSFTVSKKGYKEMDVSIKPFVRRGVLFADAMLLCLPCVIDIPSKAYMDYPRSEYKFDLVKREYDRHEETSMFDEELYVNINQVKLGFKEGDILGKINSSKMKYKEDKRYETTGNPEYYTDALCMEFKNHHLNSIKCGISRYEPKTHMLVSPDKQLFIQAEVESWNFTFTEKKKIISGNETMTTTWKILDPSDNMKVMLEKKITASLDAEERQVRYLFSRLLQKSAAQFIEDEKIYDFVLNAHLAIPETMKGETIELGKVTNPAFPKFKDLVNYATKAVVTIKQKDGFGSGVIISKAGHIVTNYHVIDAKGNVSVKLNTGITLSAKVLKTNPAADLALLKVDAQDLPSLPLSIDEIEVGEEAVAIGTPGDISLEQTVSKGIVSGKRIIEGKKFLQTDVSINPGNSGGPLLNDKGEILGIITMKIVGKGLEGLGFALSSEDVTKLLNLKIANR
jgi:hypothetical protein